jgi:hypothetical protein
MMAHLPSQKLNPGRPKPPLRMILTVPAKSDPTKQVKKLKPKSKSE